MKAMVIHRYGDPDVLELEDVAAPTPGPDQVLLKVHGSSVNPLDAGIRAGMLKTFVRLDFPAVLGVDVSGEVVDYTKGNPFAQKEAFDVVLNAVRGADEGALRGLLKRGGTLVTIVGGLVGMATSKLGNLVRRAKVVPFFVSSKSTCLEGLSKLIEDGKVEPIVEKVYPLAELREAHRRVETGRVTGKVCIDVRSIWQ